MNGKISNFKRFVSLFLCFALVIVMFPAPAAQRAYALTVGYNKVADASTMDLWRDLFSKDKLSTENAGGVWMDKSVFTDASAFNKLGISMDRQDGFLVALSTIASNMSITGASAVPTDSILVLDISGSMNESSNDLAEELVEAANSTISVLLSTNSNNRVGVVLYSGETDSEGNSAVMLLPLDRYTTAADGKYLTYTREEESFLIFKTVYEYIGIDSDVRFQSTNTAPSSQSIRVYGATDIQSGVMDAVEMFTDPANSPTFNDPTNGTVRRKPVVVLMSDGAPTLGTTNFTNLTEHDLGNGQTATGNLATALGFVTQLTLSYAKTLIADHYGDTPLLYTVGIGVSDNTTATSVLNPSNSTSAISDLWSNYNAASVGDTVTVQSGNNSKTVTKVSTSLDMNYVDKYFEVTGSGESLKEEMKKAFEDVVASIQLQTGYSPTLIYANEDLSGYVSFVDKIGKYMQVTDVKGIVIGDNVFSGAELAKNFVSGGLLGNQNGFTALGNEMIAAVKARLGIADTATAEALVNFAYEYGQLEYKNDNEFSNYIGWYANAAGDFLGFYHEGVTQLPIATGNPDTDPAFTVRSYGYLGEVDKTHGVSDSDMMYATVQVRKNIATNEELVTFAVPAALIPIVTYAVTLDEDKNLTELEVFGADAPITLLYEVALRDDINLYNILEKVSPDYISDEHFVNDDGSINFYTNQWEHQNVTGYGTKNTYGYFNPSKQNNEYYYIQDSPVYSNTNGTLYNGQTAPTGTMYSARIVYEKNGNTYVTRTVYTQIHADVLETAKAKGDGTWYIPKGDVRTAVSDFVLTKGGTAQYDAANNKSNSLRESHVAFVDTNGYKVDESGYNYYVGYTLGNNGRLTVTPQTGIKLTKELANDATPTTQKFTFTITNLNATDNTTYPALLIDAQGKESSATVKFTASKATVNLAPGETIYIGGMKAGDTFGIVETETAEYLVKTTTGLTNGAVDIVANKIAEVTFTNADRGVGNLVIGKRVSHDFGVDYNIPVDKVFTIKVTLSGIGVASKTFNATQTNSTLTSITTDANGSFTVQLKHMESIELLNLPVGTTAAVEELNIASGFSASYYVNRATVPTTAGFTTVQSDSVATVIVVNEYTPAEVYPVYITVEGTKVLTGREWLSTDVFEFEFQKLEADGTTWATLGTSTATISAQSFVFTNALANERYTEIGTYYYRIIEKTDNRIAGITYDSTVHSFAVVVGDPDMDGKLQITSVTTARPDTISITQTNSGWNVAATFTNVYSPDGTASVTIDITKLITNNGGSQQLPEGFTFGLYNVDANGNATGNALLISEGTNNRGFARISLVYRASEHIGTHTYVLKEIVPSPVPAGWTYDTKAVTVTVKVVDNYDGTISAYIYEGTQEPTAHTTSIETSFTNVYTPVAVTPNITVGGNKVLNTGNTGRGWLDTDEFTFELQRYNADGSWTILSTQTVKGTDQSKSFTFANALANERYTAVGEYYYRIIEKSDNPIAGITYDMSVHSFTVVVTDNAGQLAVSNVTSARPNSTVVTSNNNTWNVNANFINTYTATGTASVTIDITKLISIVGGDAKSPANYQFALFAVGTDGKATGSALFESALTNNRGFTRMILEYNAETQGHIGKHTYILKEIIPAAVPAGWAYSTKEVKVTIDVVDNTDGTISAYIYKGDTAPETLSASIEESFTNTYTPTALIPDISVSGEKILTGREWLTTDSFEFELQKYDPTNGKWIKIGNSQFANISNKRFSFDYVFDNGAYTSVGTYNYRVVEIKPATPIPGIAYDTTVHSFAVVVSDNAQTGKLEITSVTTARPQTTHITQTSATAWDIKTEFTNSYVASGTASVTIDINKIIDIVGGSAKSHEGYKFALFAMGQDGKATGDALYTSAVTNSRGFTRMILSYNAEKQGDIGTHTYILKEVYDSVPNGWTYSTKEVVVTVKVVDNYNGTISAYIYEGTQDPVAFTTSLETSFTNKYVPAGVSLPIDFVKKVLTGRDLIADEFEFFVLDENDNVITAGNNDADGNVIFNYELNFDAVGIYSYTIVENDVRYVGADRYVPLSEFGITVDKTIFYLDVIITDDGNGNLVAAYEIENAQNNVATFRNVYNTAPVTADPIVGEKDLVGRPLLNDEFRFILELKSINGVAVTESKNWTTTNNVDGTFSFDRITYTKAGTYVYEVYEDVPEGGYANGIHFSTEKYTVVVVIEDNLEGNLEVKSTEIENASKIEFTNVYEPEKVTIHIDGTKDLMDKTLEKDQFTFELYASNANWSKGQLIESVKNDANGKFVFGAIDIKTNTDAYYIVVEKNGGEIIDGIAYDDTVYCVFVDVYDNLNGKLGAVIHVYDEYGTPYDDITFFNVYEISQPGNAFIHGVKEFNGRDLTDNDKFTFDLYDASNGNPDIDTATPIQSVTVTKENLNFVIAIEYDEDDIGTHNYVLVERNAGETINGVAYSIQYYHITIIVRDNGVGGVDVRTIVTDVSGEIASRAVFTNVYSATEGTDVTISGDKILTGRDWTENDKFTFDLYNETQTEIIDSVTVDKNDRDFSFMLNYTADQIGTHKYVLVEKNSGQKINGITYSSQKYFITVTVVDNGDGTTTATAVVKNDENQTVANDALDFTNTYKALGEGSLTIEGYKDLAGRDWTANDSFTFDLYEAEQMILMQSMTVTKDSNRFSVRFDYEYGDIGCEYKYVIVERKAGENINGVEYSTQKYYITLIVTDNGVGGIDAELIVTDEVGTRVANDKVIFKNVYSATEGDSVTIEGTKDFAGRDWTENDTFTFDLYDETQSIIINSATVDKDNADFEFILNYTPDHIGTYKYVLVERNAGQTINGVKYSSAKYFITVTVVDNGVGGITATAVVTDEAGENTDEIVFTNVYSVTTGDSVTIEGTKDFTGRDWTDNDEFIFDLYEGAQSNIDTDTPIDSVTVNKDNVDFEFVLDYLPTDIGTYTYVLIERDGGKTINDIKYSDAKFIITVTVVDNGIGGVTATITTTDANGAPVENVEFTNTYLAPLEPELGSMAENMWTMLFVIALLGIVATTVRRKEVEQN